MLGRMDATEARQADAVTDVAEPLTAATVAGLPGRDGFASLEVDLGLLPGQDRIVINGADVSRSVLRYSMHVDRGAPAFPVVVLELRQGAAAIRGPGIVQVLPGEDRAAVSVAQAVLDFLDRVEPADVEQAMLAGGMGAGPGEAALEVIRSIARSVLR